MTYVPLRKKPVEQIFQNFDFKILGEFFKF